jgi:hypothetical protein
MFGRGGHEKMGPRHYQNHHQHYGNQLIALERLIIVSIKQSQYSPAPFQGSYVCLGFAGRLEFLFLAAMSLRYRIIASFAKWLAAQEAPAGVQAAFNHAMNFQGFDRVSGTGRLKSAVIAEQGRQKPLIQADGGDKHPTHHAATGQAGVQVLHRKRDRPARRWRPVQGPPVACLAGNETCCAGNTPG